MSILAICDFREFWKFQICPKINIFDPPRGSPNQHLSAKLCLLLLEDYQNGPRSKSSTHVSIFVFCDLENSGNFRFVQKGTSSIPQWGSPNQHLNAKLCFWRISRMGLGLNLVPLCPCSYFVNFENSGN